MERTRLTGSPSHQAGPKLLRAGSVNVIYESGSLRYLSMGGVEAVRRIYFALRDENWDTIEGTISNEVVRVAEDSFEVTFVSSHRHEEIDFVWKAEIKGGSDGEISFSFDGEAFSGFRRNRTGLCVLHPLTAAGSRCTVTHHDGSKESSMFPVQISPHQPFFSIRRIRHALTDDLECEVEFEGDVFEMEDQRNWTDGSFKIYSTPLALPFPVAIESRAKIAQRVTVRPVGKLQPQNWAVRRTVRTDSVVFEIDNGRQFDLPEIGFEHLSGGTGLTEKIRSRLIRLNPDFIRCEIRPSRQNEEELAAVLQEVYGFSVPLEVALFLGANREAELGRLERVIRKIKPHLKRVLLFDEGRKVTSPETLRSVVPLLRALAPDAKIYGGTDAFFAEINRNQPDPMLVDGLVFSVNPQVHTFDNGSLVETLGAQVCVVESARAFSSGKPICVSPITFKMRWNPNATSVDGLLPVEGLAQRVDARQLSLFGAAWTVGSIRSLAMGGAASATYYETVGPRGLMESSEPSLPRELFPSISSGIFPLYYVFLELAAYHGGKVTLTRSSAPLVAEALVVSKEGRSLAALSNYSQSPLEAEIRGISRNARVRYLDNNSYDCHSSDPERYLQMTNKRTKESARMNLSLPANGVVFVSY